MELPTAASVTSNIEGVMVCPGEELVLTCTGQGTSQRWSITGDAARIDIVFVKSDELGTLEHQGYNFTLISTVYDNFISILSTAVTIAIKNTIIECTGHSSRDSVTVLLAGTLYNLPLYNYVIIKSLYH